MALDIDFMDVVEESRDVQCVICMFEIQEDGCCVLFFCKAELYVCCEVCEIVSRASCWKKA